MPRYFFHVFNSRAIIDKDGCELPGIEEARAMAIKTAGEIIASEGMTFWLNNKWRMAVTDEAGDIFFTLDFSVDTPQRSGGTSSG